MILSQSDGTIPRETQFAEPDPGPHVTIEPTPMPTVIKATPAPTAKPISTPQATPIAQVSITPSPSPITVLSQDSTSSWFVIIIIAAAIVGAILFFKSKFKKEEKNESNKCDGIKDLLEQKKRELEEMVKSYPEDKLKDVTAEKILGKEIKNKYDKLNEAIELLQQKYNLCMLEFSTSVNNKVILVDAIDCFCYKDGTIFKEMRDLLESFANKKLLLTGANDEQFKEWGLDKMPYEVFTLKHNPEKTDLEYYKKMLEHFDLNNGDVIYFEHNPRAVESAQSAGIKTYYYNPDEKDLGALKEFLKANL